MQFFSTFRARLLLILAAMLVATVSFQYYLNLRTQAENNELREAQEQAIVAAISLAFRTIPSTDRMQDLVEMPGQTYLDENARKRIRDIIIINNEWRVTDSLSPDYLPTADENNDPIMRRLEDLENLPPLMEDARLGEDLKRFPNRRANLTGPAQDEAHAIPIETSDGRWYVMVLLKSDKSEAAWRAAQPLVFMIGILLVSSLITFLLVWRFTRPIADLSHAARDVADGDLNVRVPNAHKFDELGRLGLTFNDMVAELEKSRELEEQLRQAEKSAVVGRLGSAIAHEIRNPLNYINLTLDHLRSKYPPADADQREAFEKLTGQLKGEVARINRQISDFLNYSRPAKADLRPVAARSVIEDSLRIAEPEAEDKNVTIGVIEHEDVPQVMGDPDFLRSVFNNLLLNAIQSMESNGEGHLTVKIYADEDGPYVCFDVIDTGNGIPAENLSKIFEPYFSTKETGTGLGLAIVQKIVDVHQGSIEVTSSESEGTKFTVRLPKAS